MRIRKEDRQHFKPFLACSAFDLVVQALYTFELEDAVYNFREMTEQKLGEMVELIRGGGKNDK